MPESHKAERRRTQKANRAAGIGDEMGRIPSRVKDPPKMSKCTICQTELKITKTNTELTAHAEGKHGKTIDDCFPGAKEAAADMMKNSQTKGKGGGAPTMTKAERKKKAAAGMDDLLSAGLSTSKKKSGKK